MRLLYLSVLLLLPAPLLAQDPAEIQRLFEAGQYQPLVDQTTETSPPDVTYMAAQSYQKLGAAEQAVQTYQRLADRPDTDVWHFIGLSGRQLVENQPDAAIESARHAIEVDSQNASAHYQLGLALARREQWMEAATAFDAAIQRQPTMAYAHYYGGLMQYRAKRPDLMAGRFNEFLKLAPDAPERPEVLSIMRTIRRR